MPTDQAKEFIENRRILRLNQVKELTGLSRTGVYSRMGKNEFPQSINLGGRAVGWIESEVLDWINGRIESSRGAAA